MADRIDESGSSSATQTQFRGLLFRAENESRKERGNMANYYGTASWFQCPPSSCGTCQSNNWHAAWPKLKRPGYPDCDYSGCGMSLPWKYCGDLIFVTNLCNSQLVTPRIHDCGPAQRNYCNMSVGCGSCGSNCSALVDLTPAAFSAIADLALGRIPVRVNA